MVEGGQHRLLVAPAGLLVLLELLDALGELGGLLARLLGLLRELLEALVDLGRLVAAQDDPELGRRCRS